MDDICLLVSSCFVQLPFLECSDPPVQSWHHTHWTGHSPSINNEDNGQQISLQVNQMKAMPQTKVPLPRYVLVCVVDKKTNPQRMTDFFFSDILFNSSVSNYAFENRNLGGIGCMVNLNETTKMLMTLFPSSSEVHSSSMIISYARKASILLNHICVS